MNVGEGRFTYMEKTLTPGIVSVIYGFKKYDRSFV